MLTRLEIDNYRCFEGFIWEPAQKQLILGANGCGKSSMMDTLVNLRRFVAGDARVEELFPLKERTKWLERTEQRFSLHAEIDGIPCCYRLVVGAAGDPVKPTVQSEMLECGDVFRLSFDQGTVRIGHPDEPESLYRMNGSRSTISSLGNTQSSAYADQFRCWLGKVSCFRLNPFQMASRAEGEDAEPKVDLSNFAAWYRSLYQSHPKRAQALFKDLEESLEGFDSIVLQDAAEGVRLLNVLFRREGEKPVAFRFNELSEGQRCLICLYTILHFVVVEGRTVIIDEPESFVGLRQLQPWLKAASRMVSETDGQLILISHNPELIDQWAPEYGIRFVRDGIGPPKVEPWHGEPESGLSPAQLIARGWDDA